MKIFVDNINKDKIILREVDALALIRIGKWTLDPDGLQEALEHIFWSYKVWPSSSIRSKEGRAWIHYYPNESELEEDMPGIYNDDNKHANFFSSN